MLRLRHKEVFDLPPSAVVGEVLPSSCTLYVPSCFLQCSIVTSQQLRGVEHASILPHESAEQSCQPDVCRSSHRQICRRFLDES